MVARCKVLAATCATLHEGFEIIKMAVQLLQQHWKSTMASQGLTLTTLVKEKKMEHK